MISQILTALKKIFTTIFKLGFAISLFSVTAQAQNIQDILSGGRVNGDIQTDVKYYNVDDAMGIKSEDINGEKFRMNTFANFIYTNGNFEAGVRYEAYQNPILGYDQRYEGHGIANRYATYRDEGFDVTIGNFYEQFGTGLIFRSYENRDLGFDNSLDGVRIRVSPYKGITLKGVYGKQRFFWAKGTEDNKRGIVKGLDAEVDMNETFDFMAESKTRVIIGGSLVSKYQEDQTIVSHGDILDLPKNVGAGAARLNLINGGFNLMGEYAYKINDPSADNDFIYRKGEAAIVQASYSQKGFGISLGAKRIDNMNFRSDRTAGGQNLMINYLPALTQEHVYSLPAIYPYATQPGGEVGFQGQIDYRIPKKSALGGKYGTNISVNYSIAKSLDNTIDNTASIHEGYESDFFSVGDDTYFEDFNVSVHKKFNKKLKGTFKYVNIKYDIVAIEGHQTEHEESMVYANSGVADISYKLSRRTSIRFEGQALFTKQDDGDFAMLTVELTRPQWFIAIMDQYNYGNRETDKQIHYYNFSTGYSKGTTRVALTYGRQREGILCVGGVCRLVPAASGFGLTVTKSF